MAHILVVDDDTSFNKMLTSFLIKNEYQVSSAHNTKEAWSVFLDGNVDLVLTDFRLPDLDGLELIKKIKEKNHRIPVILMTSYSDIRTAVNSIKLGAYEFISKPLNPDHLLLILKGALSEIVDQIKSKSDDGFDHVVNSFVRGNSTVSKEMWRHIELVAPTEMSVLILGESGTGKEYVAKMIHHQSKRSQNSFVALDCGVLSKELAASELFGHQKGAFTGATHDKPGQFEMANRGTIFLDEIGNLPYDVQVQLLRAIEERKIRRIGGTKDINIDVRIITATNEKLEEAFKTDSFRKDLYYRINEFTLNVPALRNRIEDIAEFVRIFLHDARKELNKDIEDIKPEALEVLSNYDWPGNLRELKNLIKRSVLLTKNKILDIEDLPKEILKKPIHNDSMDLAIKKFDIKEINSEKERQLIVDALVKTKYNKKQAAELLNIGRKTLYNKIKKYDIE